MTSKTFVLYHAHCADGFAAAYAAWCALGDTATYLPVAYHEPMPAIPDGSTVFIVDFSYPREILQRLADRSHGLTVIDHHKTAQAALAGLPYAHFDMAKSGAVLTWEHFQGAGNCIGPVPPLLLYVQDRDLWQWQLPDSHAVSAALTLHPRDFNHWQILADDPNSIARLAQEGRTVLATHAALIASICQRASSSVIEAAEDIEAMTVNTPVLQSECCHALLQQHPGFEVAAAYFDEGKKRQWSLRSRTGGVDVSAIAKAHGGGGHASAAGFTETLA